MRGNAQTAVSASSTPSRRTKERSAGRRRRRRFVDPFGGEEPDEQSAASRGGQGGSVPPGDPAPAEGPSRSPGDRSEADDDDEICEPHTQSPTQPSHFALHPVAAGEGGRASLRRFRPSSYRGGGVGGSEAGEGAGGPGRREEGEEHGRGRWTPFGPQCILRTRRRYLIRLDESNVIVGNSL